MSKQMLTTTVFLSACLFSVFVIAVCCVADVHPKSFEVIETPEMYPRFNKYLDLSTDHPIPVVSVTFEYRRYPKEWKLDVVRRVGVHIPKVSDNQRALSLPDLRTPPPIQYRTLKAQDMSAVSGVGSVFPVFEFSSRLRSSFGLSLGHSYWIIVTEHRVPPLPPTLPIISPIADAFTDSTQKAKPTDIDNWIKHYIQLTKTYYGYMERRLTI